MKMKQTDMFDYVPLNVRKYKEVKSDPKELSSFCNFINTITKDVKSEPNGFIKVCDNCKVERSYIPVIIHDHAKGATRLDFCVMCYEDLKDSLEIDV